VCLDFLTGELDVFCLCLTWKS